MKCFCPPCIWPSNAWIIQKKTLLMGKKSEKSIWTSLCGHCHCTGRKKYWKKTHNLTHGFQLSFLKDIYLIMLLPIEKKEQLFQTNYEWLQSSADILTSIRSSSALSMASSNSPFTVRSNSANRSPTPTQTGRMRGYCTCCNSKTDMKCAGLQKQKPRSGLFDVWWSKLPTNRQKLGSL